MIIALVGYYDTGNLGDEIQRQVAERMLANAGHQVVPFTIGLPRDGWAVFLEDEQSFDRLNECDAVVFGGCLLFQKHIGKVWHNMTRTRLPTALLCVGTEYELELHSEPHLRVIENAVHVTFRHSGYIGSTGSTLGADLAYLTGFRPVEQGDTLTICAKWTHIHDLRDSILHCIDTFRFSRCRYIIMDAHAGRPSDYDAISQIEHFFPGIEVCEPRTVDELHDAFADSAAVIASRRHGGIMAAMSGMRPVMLVDHSRLYDVHRSFWSYQWGCDLDSIGDRVASAMNHPVTEAEIQPLRDRARLAIDACLESIGRAL